MRQKEDTVYIDIVGYPNTPQVGLDKKPYTFISFISFILALLISKFDACGVQAPIDYEVQASYNIP